VAGEYQVSQYKDLIVDTLAMQIVINPDHLTLLLLPNLYGDVMSDLASGLVGGIGLGAQRNNRLEAADFLKRWHLTGGRRLPRYRRQKGLAHPPGAADELNLGC